MICVPIVKDVDFNIPYEEGLKSLKALEPLGQDYMAIVRKDLVLDG